MAYAGERMSTEAIQVQKLRKTKKEFQASD